jgi:hypothetical protein
MMLSLVGETSDLDAFDYFLALKLGCFVSDLDRMSHAEYVGWQAWFESHNAISNPKRIM